MLEKTYSTLEFDRFTVEWDNILDISPMISSRASENGLYEFTLNAELNREADIGDFQVRIRPRLVPDFFYTSHLSPNEDSVIDMHVFRTPAMMMGENGTVVCVMPVVDGVKNSEKRYYMDFNAPEAVMTVGLTTTALSAHILYRRTGELVLPKGSFSFSFAVMELCGEMAENPFRSVLSHWWNRYGSLQSSVLPDPSSLMPYVKHTYDWAFKNWKDEVWQEFELNGKRVGAPQMIVTVNQSPNFKEPFSIREAKAIWNQAWFCSLRSAQGVFRFAKETGDESLLEKALLTKELALSFSQNNGFFDAVIGTATVKEEINGKEYLKSAPWSEAFFGNSNRNPYTWDMRLAPYHILDMSWTALHMLSWYEELEKDERLIKYVRNFADRLITLQDKKGYFPGWIDKNSGEHLELLRQSPESAVSATLLIKLYGITGDRRYLDSALKCADILIKEVMPESRWEDYETYYSCSNYGRGSMEGKKFERNNSYKQCSLSPFYMAQALYEAHRVTGEERYLRCGIRCLDEMLMFQSSFQPDYMPIPVVGGFGVMNCDSELNDARQSMFAELIMQYGELLDLDEYRERSSAALRASFSMMYCPENPEIKKHWEKKYPHFNEKDYGFMMENYGHDGYVNEQNLGLGVFTIYDWGNGAASEAVMRMKAHYKELFE